METIAEKQYSMLEACRLIGVEAHVLRYWEKELEIAVPRNSLGHRYYLDSHIELFLKAKELKASGYQLKAVKNEIHNSGKTESSGCGADADEPRNPDFDMEKFRISIAETVLAAVRLGNRELNSMLGERIISRLDSVAQLQEELQEERFRKLDETIRNCQRERKEAAAKEQKRFGFILR